MVTLSYVMISGVLGWEATQIHPGAIQSIGLLQLYWGYAALSYYTYRWAAVHCILWSIDKLYPDQQYISSSQ